jgi:hypothetical protein
MQQPYSAYQAVSCDAVVTAAYVRENPPPELPLNLRRCSLSPGLQYMKHGLHVYSLPNTWAAMPLPQLRLILLNTQKQAPACQSVPHAQIKACLARHGLHACSTRADKRSLAAQVQKRAV